MCDVTKMVFKAILICSSIRNLSDFQRQFIVNLTPVYQKDFRAYSVLILGIFKLLVAFLVSFP